MYDEQVLSKYMLREEFEKILQGADKILSKTYSKKRKSNKQGVPLIFKLLLILAVIFGLGYICMGYFIPTQGIIF